jgi:adenylyltransferase/sulfurtransferase
LLPGIGEEGQVKLKSSSILVVGCGGLGCPIISQLAAVGIGKISIIDDDVVSLSNLNRQFLFAEKDIGRKKVDVAAEFVRKQNPLCQIQTYDALLNENNVIDLICSHDIIIDATDSYETRYLINKVCVQKEKPFIFGSVQGFVGQVALFENSGNAPCYQCTFPAAPLKESRKSCDVNGVLGNLPSLIGSVQTSKALKHILFGTNDHTLFQYNFIAETYKKYQMTKNKHCFCSNEDK